jgi:hypothetical protein
LTEPWASLVALGAKKVETRSWATPHRGPLAVHAAKGFPLDCRILCRQNPFYAALSAAMSFRDGVPCYSGYTDIMLETPEKYLPRGVIVAVCDLVDVVPATSDRWVTDSVIGKHLFGKDSDWWLLHGRNDPREQEYLFGDYAPGRYMWLLSDVVVLPKSIPARGRLGLWEVDLVDPRGGARGERTVEG